VDIIITVNPDLAELVHDASWIMVDTTFAVVHGTTNEWKLLIWLKGMDKSERFLIPCLAKSKLTSLKGRSLGVSSVTRAHAKPLSLFGTEYLKQSNRLLGSRSTSKFSQRNLRFLVLLVIPKERKHKPR
jgi:hypothetical protein